MSDATETKEVLTPVTPVTGPLFSLRAYARHRKVSATAVHRAIESGRLVQCVARAASGKFRGITDLELADREWAASTDLTKAPMSVILRSEEVPQPGGEAALADASTPADAAASSDTVDPEHLSLSNATAREKHWKAKTAEIEYKTRIGELVDAKEVEARMVDEYSNCRTKLLGLARKAKAALPHLSLADVVAIDNLVREALEDLAGPPVAAPPSESP